LQFHARLDGMYSITEALHDLWDRLQPWGTLAEAGQAAARPVAVRQQPVAGLAKIRFANS
jgi:hypothetical protein